MTISLYTVFISPITYRYMDQGKLNVRTIQYKACTTRHRFSTGFYRSNTCMIFDSFHFCFFSFFRNFFLNSVRTNVSTLGTTVWTSMVLVQALNSTRTLRFTKHETEFLLYQQNDVTKDGQYKNITKFSSSTLHKLAF